MQIEVFEEIESRTIKSNKVIIMETEISQGSESITRESSEFIVADIQCGKSGNAYAVKGCQLIVGKIEIRESIEVTLRNCKSSGKSITGKIKTSDTVFSITGHTIPASILVITDGR